MREVDDEIGDDASQDQLYRLTYDGQVADEHGYAVVGGAADVVASYLKEHYREGASLSEAVSLAVSALGHTANERGEILWKAFEKLNGGEFDDVPEQAFVAVGGMDDVMAKAKQLQES